MGKDLYEGSPAAKEIFDEADKALGFSLSKLCFEGPFDELTQTSVCQPAVLTASIASLQTLKVGRSYFEPLYVAGLSLGEYSALVAAGVMSFQDAVYLVRKRGEFMEEASRKFPGKMSCILGLELSVVEDICSQTGAQAANLNCPGQVVVSGTQEQIKKVSELALQHAAKRVITLDVSGAFHSSHMDEASLKLKSEIDKIEFRKPNCPLICNVDAKEHTDAQKIKLNLIKQVNSATYWEASMRYLLGKGIDCFYEIGPGSVLKGLFRKIDSVAKVVNVGKISDADGLEVKA